MLDELPGSLTVHVQDGPHLVHNVISQLHVLVGDLVGDQLDDVDQAVEY